MRRHGLRAAVAFLMGLRPCGSRPHGTGENAGVASLNQNAIAAHTDTMAAVFTCTHCNTVPEHVVDGKAAIGLVVEDDPNIAPIPGVAKCSGFAYRRTPADGELLIRVNDYAETMTDEGRRIWTFQPIEP